MTRGDPHETSIAIPGLLSYADALAMERRILDCVGSSSGGHGESVRFLAAIWQTERSIILPSGMSRREGVASAARISECAGWPIFERATGGDVTPQFHGVLNISLGFVLSGTERNIKTAYQRLTEPLIVFLKRELGIEAYTSSVKGAFCDGAYNLVVEGRKLAGTAQRWKVIKPVAGDSSQETAVLGHAALLLGHDLNEALNATNAFFEAWGSDRRIDHGAHVTIAELAGARAGEPEWLASRLSGFMSKELGALPPPPQS